jgi:hypothetical protein
LLRTPNSGSESLSLKLARTDGTNDVTPPDPALYDITDLLGPGTWFIFEMESSGSKVTERTKDATGTTTLGTISITDSTPLSGGKVLFYN